MNKPIFQRKVAKKRRRKGCYLLEKLLCVFAPSRLCVKKNLIALYLKIALFFALFHRRFRAFVVGTCAPLGLAGNRYFGNHLGQGAGR